MRGRLALLAVAFALLAVPAANALAAICTTCCPQADEDPCGHGHGATCERMGATPCCDEGPETPPSPGARSVDAPALQALATAQHRSPPRPPAARLRAELAALSSPLRFSVVLRI